MARKITGRKPRSRTGTTAASSLIAALKFIAVAQKKNGQVPYQSHCSISNGMATAYDGNLTIGHPVEDDVAACPNTLLLLNALQKCGEQLSITQLDSGRLAVKSDGFRAMVPCEQFQSMPHCGPDIRCATIDNRIRTGFEMVSPLAEEDAGRAILAATLLQANTVAATNGKCLLEYWHGIDLPPNILLPKTAVKAIVASNKNLVGFGFSHGSATFFFEDGAYIKTQLFEDSYPDINSVLNKPCNPWPLPEKFFDGVKTLESFCPENRVVYFSAGVMRSHADANEGASYEVPGLCDRMAFNADYLLLCEPALQKVHFMVEEKRAMFFSNDNMLRGVIMGCESK